MIHIGFQSTGCFSCKDDSSESRVTSPTEERNRKDSEHMMPRLCGKKQSNTATCSRNLHFRPSQHSCRNSQFHTGSETADPTGAAEGRTQTLSLRRDLLLKASDLRGPIDPRPYSGPRVPKCWTLSRKSYHMAAGMESSAGCCPCSAR